MNARAQKSIPVDAAANAARAPKRERGKLRVAALMDAGAAVIAERGYGVATMTEIAARAKASIGSLYQFFPSKEALGDALLARYGERVAAALDAVLLRAQAADADSIAEGLLGIMTGLKADRPAVLALLEARDESKAARLRLRQTMLDRMANILMKAAPQLPPSRAGTMAVMLLYMLKSVPQLLDENPAHEAELRREARTAMALYIAHGLEN